MFTEFRNVHRQLEITGSIKQNYTETDFERIICDPTNWMCLAFTTFQDAYLWLFLNVIIHNAARIV
jgi:hypothetical protein